MVDVGLTTDLLMAILNFFRGLVQLLVGLAQSVLGLGQLDLDIAQRIFQLLVLDLGQSEHLAVLIFSSLLVVDSEAATAKGCVTNFVLQRNLVAPNI